VGHTWMIECWKKRNQGWSIGSPQWSKQLYLHKKMP